MATDHHAAAMRVLELCEALTQPSLAKGARYLVTFEDGSTLDMDTVLQEGRAALQALADLFTPAIGAETVQHVG